MQMLNLIPLHLQLFMYDATLLDFVQLYAGGTN